MTTPGKRIHVEVRRTEAAQCGALECFEHACAAWGESAVCLLESAEGPERDCKVSVIAADPCFTVELRDDLLHLSGESQVVACARGACATLPNVRVEAEGGVRLLEPEAVWNCLRVIASCFEVTGHRVQGYDFGFLGYLGYDIASAIEKLPRTLTQGADLPTLCLRIYRTVFLVDRESNVTVVTTRATGCWDFAANDVVAEVLSNRLTPPRSDALDPRSVVTETMTKSQYIERAQRALEYIRIGDIYQVQVGYEILVQSKVTPNTVYRRLRQRNPSPYMYLTPFGETVLVGASPESFFKIEGDLVTMRPIAGTAPRGATPEDDAARVVALVGDPKERAEHIMLVDLCRNDVGRICRRDTLDVTELIHVEKFSHVNHLVSTVVGRMREDVDTWDVVAATFPAGTMTGAPKVRAMEIIEELELSRRGAYAGAVGLIGFKGYANLALCIRSTAYTAGAYSLRASAGIVADSSPESEWNETRHKMGSTFWAVVGREIDR